MSKVIAVMCLLLAVPAAAHAETPAVVVGSGTFDFGIGPGQLAVAAQKTPSGVNGHIRLDVAGTAFADVEAAVTCAEVRDGQAVVGGALSEPVLLWGYLYTHVLVYLDDSGPASDEPDAAYAVLRTSAVDCTMFDPSSAYPAEHGTVVVGGGAP